MHSLWPWPEPFFAAAARSKKPAGQALEFRVARRGRAGIRRGRAHRRQGAARRAARPGIRAAVESRRHRSGRQRAQVLPAGLRQRPPAGTRGSRCITSSRWAAAAGRCHCPSSRTARMEVRHPTPEFASWSCDASAAMSLPCSACMRGIVGGAARIRREDGWVRDEAAQRARQTGWTVLGGQCRRAREPGGAAAGLGRSTGLHAGRSDSPRRIAAILSPPERRRPGKEFAILAYPGSSTAPAES